MAVGALAAHDKAIDAAGHLEFTLRAAFAREHAGRENLGDLRLPLRLVVCRMFLLGASLGWQAFSLAGAAIIFAILLVPGCSAKSEPILQRSSRRKRLRPGLRLRRRNTCATSANCCAVTQNHFAASHRPKKNFTEPEKHLPDFWRCLSPTIFRLSNSARW